MINYIKQRYDWDCGIACLAMAAGIPYEQAISDLWPNDKHGINELHLYDWMIDHGWSWQQMYQNTPKIGRLAKRDPWPPKPFAPVHIALVHATRGPHFVAMDELGEVFDPWDKSRTTLKNHAYKNVSSVIGMFKI